MAILSDFSDKLSDRFGDPFGRFKYPERINDNHLLVFFIQLIIITACFLIWMYLILTNIYDYTGVVDKNNYIPSLINSLRVEEGEPKYFREFFTYPWECGQGEAVVTDKTFDFEKKGIWLTYKRDVLRCAWAFGCAFTGIILMICGIGNVFGFVRDVIGIVSINLLPLSLLILPFIIWAMALSVLLMVAGGIMLYLFPLNLLYHLIMGIIQLFVRLKSRDSSPSAAVAAE